jgi:hypothetical protein
VANTVTQLFGAGAALLAGYLFVRFSTYRRYTAEHLRTDRFALHVVAYAIVFFPAGAVMDHYIRKWFGHPDLLESLRSAGLPPIVIYSSGVALVAAVIDNIVTLMRMSDDSTLRLTDDRSLVGRMRLASIALFIRNSNDPAIRTLFRASFLRKFLLVTLKSGKVYVGQTPRLPDPADSARSFRIPIKSGYRDPVTKKVTLGTRYDDLLTRLSTDEPTNGATNAMDIDDDDPLRQDLAVLDIKNEERATIDLEDFGVVILWTEIESLSIYDPNIYEAFQQKPNLVAKAGGRFRGMLARRKRSRS